MVTGIDGGVMNDKIEAARREINTMKGIVENAHVGGIGIPMSTVIRQQLNMLAAVVDVCEDLMQTLKEIAETSVEGERGM